jgi:hypothetical protein
MKPLLYSLTILLLAGGCVVRETRYRDRPVVVQSQPVVVQSPPVVTTTTPEVIVTTAPPAPRVEVMSPSPGSGYVWVSGAWVWRDRWVWEPGRWSKPPHPGAVWDPHKYEYKGNKHVWYRGGWVASNR